jgi:hypothetical protein
MLVRIVILASIDHWRVPHPSGRARADNVVGTLRAKNRDAARRFYSPLVHAATATLRAAQTKGVQMTTMLRSAALAAVASLLLSGAAFAQTPPPAPMAKPATAEKGEVPHTAASLECSKQADAKGLHGKERKKFRSECRKNAEHPK